MCKKFELPVVLVILLSAGCFAGEPPAAPAADAKAVKPSQPIAADLYIDMEAGKPGDVITLDLLNSMTHGQGGKWFLSRGREKDSAEPLTEFTVSERKASLPVSVVVGGVTYKNTAGKRGWACEMLTPMRSVAYTFSANHPSVSVGFFFEYHSTMNYTPIDMVIIAAQDGDFVVFQTTEHPRTPAAHIHTGDNWGPGGKKGSKVGPNIPMENNKLYWVTMRFVQSGESSLALYDPTTWKQVGQTSNLTLTSNSPAHLIRIGRTDAHGVLKPATVYFDDFIMDWTKVVFPLLPQ